MTKVKNVLIYCTNNRVAKELITAGNLIGAVTALVLTPDDAKELAACGASVLLHTDPSILPADTAAVAELLALAGEQADASVILLGSDRRGKELAGRVASAMGSGCVSDVKAIDIDDTGIKCTHLAFGGATVAIDTICSEKQVIAISPASFEAAPSREPSTIQGFSSDIQPSVRVVSSEAKSGELVDLESAEVIVAVGMGVKQEDIVSADGLAKALGGVLACSKPVATDRKYLSEERIIGLSGVICKPKLAILIGISGQVQFSVGIRDTKTIIAVNSDENADMIKMSDYVYIKDAKVALSELNSVLVGA